jgi:hypothetical protein
MDWNPEVSNFAQLWTIAQRSEKPKLMAVWLFIMHPMVLVPWIKDQVDRVECQFNFVGFSCTIDE